MTPSDLSPAVERLRRLDTEATEAPWHASTTPHPEAVRLKKEAVSLYGPDCLIYSMALNYECLPDTHARQRIDAELIAEMRNAMPSLLHAAEQWAKVQAMKEAIDAGIQGCLSHAATGRKVGDPAYYSGWERSAATLRDLLALLNAPTPAAGKD